MRIGRRQKIDAPHTASGLPPDDAAECCRAEESLQVTNCSLTDAQALAHLGSWEYDLSTNRLIWSDEVYRIFGLDRAKFVPSFEALVARIHPDDRAAFEKDYANSVANHRVHDIEHRILVDGGTPKYVHERGCTFYDADGRPLRSVGTVQDISERKKSEAVLKRSEMQLANALALTHAAPWEYDVASNLFTFNDMFYAMLGTTAEQVGGYQMSPAEYAKRFVYPDDIPVVAGETFRSQSRPQIPITIANLSIAFSTQTERLAFCPCGYESCKTRVAERSRPMASIRMSPSSGGWSGIRRCQRRSARRP